MSTEQKLQKEIEVLDREARDALDKLADKRDELEHQHQATGLAAERQREREEEKRRQAEEKAREAALKKARQEHQKLAEERYEIEVGVEEAMTNVLEGLDRLKTHEGELNQAAQAAELRTHRDLALTIIPNWLSSRLWNRLDGVRELSDIYRKPLYELDSQSQEPPTKRRDKDSTEEPNADPGGG